MAKKCLIVALEGPDKMGKTTQAKAVAKALSGSFYQKIPAKDGVTFDKIYNMLDTGEAVAYPHFFQSMNGINRMLWQKQQLPKISQDHDIIILDRWRASTIVYGMGVGMTREQCDIVIKDLIEPDLTFVFTGTPFDRVEEGDDAYEADRNLQENVRQGYKDLCKENESFISVGDFGTMEMTTNFILEKIKEYNNG